MNIKKFLHNESAGGVILFCTATLAFLLSNSPFRGFYDSLLDEHTIHFINDGLMAIFFLLIGLEVKREIVEGELSTRAQAILPVIAALGGIICPALIFIFFNWGDALAMQGWAIPVATDIAFAVGVLALVGRRVPFSLKILLLSLAIVDDIAAIIIITLFYTQDLQPLFLIGAALAVGVNIFLNRRGVTMITPYILVGMIIWICIYKSGIHATLAGILTAFTIPLDPKGDSGPLERLEHALHPYVSFLILPLFAFTNAGVNLEGVTLNMLQTPLPIGIAAGLFFGKQFGVFSFIWLGTKLGLCHKPADASWCQIYGIAVLTGIGFTMSLFIGLLAFNSSVLTTEIRIAVFSASLLSAVIGYMILRICGRGARYEQRTVFTP